MRRQLTGRARGYAAVAGGLLVAALASGDAALAVVAVPLLVLLGLGLSPGPPSALTARLDAKPERMLEGETVQATITLTRHGGGPGGVVDVELGTAPGLRAIPPGIRRASIGASGRTFAFELRGERWGAHHLGPVTLHLRDRFGLLTWTTVLLETVDVRVFPSEQRLRELLVPGRTQPFLGAHVSTARGEGIEFADVRPFSPGDRVRHINWRATARRPGVFVNVRHPERSSDVVLLLDTFAEARSGDDGSLGEAVRATIAIARRSLAARERIGLIDLGGTLRWLDPSFGPRQMYRIIEALMASEIAFSYASRSVESIPRRILPPGALVLAISPLLDERSLSVLVDLRHRGYDLSVLEVSPLPFTLGRPGIPANAERLWQLRREAQRARLRRLGIAVSVWRDEGPLDTAVGEVNAFRRALAPGWR